MDRQNRLAGGPKSATIAVPTRDRGAVLRECIRRVTAEMRASAWSTELLIVDTSRGRPDILDDLVAQVDGRHAYFGDVPFSLVRARNTALTLAHGDIVVYLDDDCFVRPGWLDALLEPYRTLHAVATGGRIIYHPWEPDVGPSTVASLDLARDLIAADWRSRPSRPVRVPHLPGGNFSVLRRVALDVGGFDPAYSGSGHLEETDFFVRLGQIHDGIWFTADAVAEHRAAARTDGVARARHNFLYRKSAVRNRLYLLRKYRTPAGVRRSVARHLRDTAAGVAGYIGHAAVFGLASLCGVVEGLTAPVDGVPAGLGTPQDVRAWSRDGRALTGGER